MNKRLYRRWLSLTLLAATAEAAVLDPKTVTAWEDYVHAADLRIKTRIQAGHFLWMEEMPARMQRVRQGEIVAVAFEGQHPRSVPGGLIHDWIGAAYVPNATLQEVLAVVRNYDRYQEYYNPTVVDSRTISESDSGDRFAMTWLNKALFLSTALEGEYRSSYARLDERRCYVTSYSTRVQEIQNFRETGERKLPPDEGSGYIWRVHSISKFEERDGGVYIELEAMALSRPVPIALHWVVDPIVSRLSRNSLMVSLRQSREAVRSAGELAARGNRQHEVMAAAQAGGGQ